MTKQRKTNLLIILAAMALLQAPLMYFLEYADTSLSFAVTSVYLITAFALTVLLLIKVIGNKTTNTSLHFWGLLIVLMVVFMLFKFDALQRFDFCLRKSKREQAIELLKNNKLNIVGVLNKDTILQLPPSLIPASCDGKIWLLKRTNQYVTVEFYSHFGFSGNSSGFLYTNDPQVIKYHNDSDNKYSVRYTDNWYWVNY